MLILAGILILCLGLVAEILSRTYYESQGKPIYAVRTMRSHDQQAPLTIHHKVTRMDQVIAGSDVRATG